MAGRPFAVTNTTPIISLVGIGQLGLLDDLFERVVVPFAVWTELADKPGAPEPQELALRRNIMVLPTLSGPPEAAHLHAGERAAIAFALSRPGAWVLLDERDARETAKSLGLQVRGTLGILGEAKRVGLIPEVRPLVERMVQNGSWLAPPLIEAVLRSVGE